MPLRIKLAVVILAGIFAVLAVFLLIGYLQDADGGDSNNSDVSGNTSQTE